MRNILFISLMFLFGCQNSADVNENTTSMQGEKNMKTLGLIGGTSWRSTVEYYRYINEAVNAHFGNNTNHH